MEEEKLPLAKEMCDDEKMQTAQFYELNEYGGIKQKIDLKQDSKEMELKGKEPLLMTIIIITGIILLIFMTGI